MCPTHVELDSTMYYYTTVWKQNESVVSTWASCAHKVQVVQPSSATAERVFSLLKSSFSKRQGHSLQCYSTTCADFVFAHHTSVLFMWNNTVRMEE